MTDVAWLAEPSGAAVRAALEAVAPALAAPGLAREAGVLTALTGTN
jgi:hypothetical protein